MLMVAACHGSSRPTYDDKLIAPEAKGLKLGTATLADVQKAFPDVTVDKDKSLGGDKIVEYNDKKAIAFDAPNGTSGHIVDGVLVNLHVHEPNACSWLIKTMDGLDGSRSCPGNRKTGKSRDNATAYYCASLGDRVVAIECDHDGYDYHIMSIR
ncbi:MAG: hypothetical protein JO257_11310 [Deltaproteobacteria bacterium]|nr:hypothetical protein [Deltaproteobacteria bacterium]